ncbi:hypothetical protein BYT27DRAFT_7259594 [Phlegmacium glaucopus]|nr:hypothetical protein BYT27DRAFT_7259594 [Phlegmacium glaucopus]
MSLTSNLLFKPTVPQQPIATVILVENSQAMSYIWSDLQDQYLNKLVDKLVVANPFAPLTVSVLESYPSQDHGSNSSFPRQYSGYHDGLRDLKFNFAPENRISPGRVNNCIDTVPHKLLDSGKFQGQTLSLHLIIIAATTPSDESNVTYFPDNFSPWLHLAQKLAKKNVHCHIVASPHQNMTALTMLFDETLRLQNRIEAMPPFLVDPAKIMLRLSAQPMYGGYPESASSNQYPSQRIIPSRRDSYPIENFYVEFDDASGPAPSSNETDPAPSLVSQLQQVHGLTKKKVYGTRPPRQPFFRDERVRDKYRKVPTPLTMPSSVTEEVPSPSAGGKVVSQSRVDRMNRVVGQASPTDLHSRRQHPWPRRGSRLSTPEPEGMSSPPSTSTVYDLSPGSPYLPSDMSSPVTPVTMTEESYNLSAGHVQNVQPALPVYQIGTMSEQGWPQQPHYHSGYHSLPQQQYFPPQISNFYNATGHIIEHADIQTLEQQRPPSVPSSHSPGSYSNYAPTPMLTPPIVSSQSYPMNDTPMTSVTAPTRIISKDATMHAPKPSQRSSKKIVASEEDEERFMFGQEFVAATAALFEAEVLPAYPNFPGMSSGLTTSSNQGVLPYLTASQAGELYASRVRRPGEQQRQQQQATSSLPLPVPSAPPANVYSTNGLMMSSYSSAPPLTSYQPQGTSSLTGWAG